MDVLAPQLQWIGNRCYRVNRTQSTENQNAPTESGYVEEDLYNDEDVDDFEIELTDNDRYKTSFHIPAAFYSQIIGSKGATKKRIEVETKTQIKIPQRGDDGDIEIIGPTRESVASSRRKINVVALAARKKQQFTHFLCVPLLDQEIVQSFLQLKKEILFGPDAFDASLFQKPSKLHITLVLLSLMDNEDRAYAAQLLKDCHEIIIKPILEECGPIKINIRGLDYMNDDPKSVHVLYAKIESEPLQMIADNIADYFAENGLTHKKPDGIKLHATIINTKFRDDVSESDEQRKRQNRIPFDARSILDKFGNFSFGSVVLNDIHLSQRHTMGSDGFYEATAIVKF